MSLHLWSRVRFRPTPNGSESSTRWLMKTTQRRTRGLEPRANRTRCGRRVSVRPQRVRLVGAMTCGPILGFLDPAPDASLTPANLRSALCALADITYSGGVVSASGAPVPSVGSTHIAIRRLRYVTHPDHFPQALWFVVAVLWQNSLLGMASPVSLALDDGDRDCMIVGSCRSRKRASGQRSENPSYFAI